MSETDVIQRIECDKEQGAAMIQEHIKELRLLMQVMVLDLLSRAAEHDRTKLEEPELSLFSAYMHRKKEHTYGSEGHNEGMRLLGPALEHHYRFNSHHPEHFRSGINAMSLMDLAEMLCDWVVSAEHHPGSNPESSLEIGIIRFGIDGQLAAILRNTIKSLQRLRLNQVQIHE